MKCVAFSITIFFGLVSLSVCGQYNVMGSKRADTIRIDPEKIQGDSNYTALNCSSGLYIIGDTVIDLSGFNYRRQEISFSDVYFDKNFVAIGIIKTRGSSRQGSGYKEDTMVIRGKLNQLKRGVVSNPDGEYYPEDRFKNNCPPMVCGHYYIAVVNKRNKVQVNSPGDLHRLIPSIRSVSDAFFFIDDQLFQEGKYQLVKDGYLILVNKVVRQCRVQYADLLYHVSFAGKVTSLGQQTTQITNLCY